MRIVLITAVSAVCLLLTVPPTAADDAGTKAMDHFIRGCIADELEDTYRAVYHYQEALRYDSTAAFVHVALSQDYLLLGDAEKALETLNQALRIQPQYAPALELLAFLYRRMNRLTDAQSLLVRLNEARPNNKEYLIQLLSVSLTLGDFQAVDTLYSKLAGLNGGTEDLSRQVLAFYLMSNEHERAIPMLKDLIAQDSTDAALIYALGTSYLQTGDSADASALIEKATEMEPEEPRYWIGRAITAFDNGETENVIEIVKTAFRYIEDNAALHSIIGTAYNRLGRTDSAIVELEKAISIDTTLFTAMGTLALIYDAEDSLERVVNLYSRAITLSDSAAVYMNNLAYTYADRGIQLDEARYLVMRALERDPTNASYLDTIGWIEFRLGRYNEAISWLKKALKQDPASAPILEHLGDVYREMGSVKRSQKYYRRAVELDPENESLRQKTES